MVRTEDACEIIKYALQNEIKVYLDGGWGVDALLKRESRIHNDIDLFVELKHYHDYIYVIKQHGFEEVNTDYTTDGHTVWKDDKQRIIDLHCFEFTDDGIVYEGDIFPSKTFSGIGKVGDITVSCIEPLSQMVQSEQLLQRDVRKYDEAPEWQLPEPGAFASAKSFRDKVVMPFVSKLKTLIKNLTIQCVRLKEEVLQLRK